MEKEQSSKKKLLIGGVIFVLLIAVLAIVYVQFAPKGTKGSKNIEIEVTFRDKSTKTYKISTDEEFLRGALEQEDLIQGTESEMGLYVTSVSDEVADDNNKEWWCFTKGGEMLSTGVDSTPINDKDHFEAVLSVW